MFRMGSHTIASRLAATKTFPLGRRNVRGKRLLLRAS